MISISDARSMWARIGLLSFGGPAGQIALMHREVIDERKLIEEKAFLSALNFCMLLPGPEAMQLATYIGWRLNGWLGGLTAGVLFVLPGAITLFALSTVYVVFGKLPLVESIFWGVKCAVLVIVLEALQRVSKRALKSASDYVIAILAFLALFCFAVPFPVVVALAALFGFLLPPESKDPAKVAALPATRESLKRLSLWLALWFAPLAAIHGSFGRNHVFTGLADFFSKLSVVTFGGAYAVLAYMGQDVVETKHWLTAPQMMDGLALAETTPGPLILVGQYVGFLAAHGAAGTLTAGFFGGLIFLWMTFVPCFLWIFVGAPYLDFVQSQPRFAAALARITAAVAGVILNLSLWFGLNVLIGHVERLPGAFPLWWPNWAGFDWAASIVAIISGLALLHFHWGMFKTLALAAGLGIIWKYLILRA